MVRGTGAWTFRLYSKQAYVDANIMHFSAAHRCVVQCLYIPAMN